MSASTLVIALAAALAPASPSQTEPFRYRGLCEASAAAIIGPNRFAVASDDADIIRIYERGTADPLPDLDVAIEGATDLEAAASSGGRLYWITSHSLNKNGVDEDERKQLIETAMAGETLTVVGRHADLRARISRLLRTPNWPLEASLNIEGMAGTPDGDLLIGLRAPLREKKAAILRIRRPYSLTGGPAPASNLSTPVGRSGRGPLWWLDLDRRGIRSLDAAGTDAQAYLILAGPIGESDRKPALFWWDGNAAEVTPGPPLAVEDVLPDGENLKSRHIVPEALLRWPDGTIQILGDNEANCKEGQGQVWFPSVDVRP